MRRKLCASLVVHSNDVRSSGQYLNEWGGTVNVDNNGV